MVKVKENLEGKTYGKLKVIEQVDDYISPKGNRIAKWKCKCKCGNICIIQGNNLKAGNTKSCGCEKYKKRNYPHKKARKYNKYNLNKEYGIGYTKDNKEFWFDKEDYEKIKDFYWKYDKKGYLYTRERSGEKRKKILFHRYILGEIKQGYVVDHKIHNHGNEIKYDNRKENLEIKTNSQNMMNVEYYKNTSSHHIGIQYDKTQKKWQARIGVNKKRIHLGWYKTEEEAIEARKKAEEKYYKKNSYENIRKESKNECFS